MKRQQIRKLLLITALLLFPITIYYFSPALIISAGLEGIINGSFIVFAAMLVLSIVLGRSFCGYLCPAGGLQECLAAVKPTSPKQGWKNRIKYVVWALWIAIIIIIYFRNGMDHVDFTYQTQYGISVLDISGYIVYYGIVLLIAIPTLIGGKRTFCHYFCWMAPFMVFGTKIRQVFHLPGLHIGVQKQSCVSCGKCNTACPMSLDVQKMVEQKIITSNECIQCGACVDSCPKQVLQYKMKDGVRHGK